MCSNYYVYLTSLLIFGICLNAAFQINKGDTTPTVHIELNGAGFHRFLTIRIIKAINYLNKILEICNIMFSSIIH